MDEKYFAKKIEQKWQKKWAETGAFNAEIDDERPKFFQLEMLPYPSGNLHMGHVRNYSAGVAAIRCQRKASNNGFGERLLMPINCSMTWPRSSPAGRKTF